MRFGRLKRLSGSQRAALRNDPERAARDVVCQVGFVLVHEAMVRGRAPTPPRVLVVVVLVVGDSAAAVLLDARVGDADVLVGAVPSVGQIDHAAPPHVFEYREAVRRFH
jgi:hypothetical protein